MNPHEPRHDAKNINHRSTNKSSGRNKLRPYRSYHKIIVNFGEVVKLSIKQEALPVRKRMRLAGYDYAQGGYYFITICTNKHQHYFGEINEGKMHLNKAGAVIEKELQEMPVKEKVILPTYVIMPNHLHFIVKPEAGTELSKIIRRFKGRTTNAIHSGLWQRNYYEHIIRFEQEYWGIIEYIETNPENWEKDKDNWR